MLGWIYFIFLGVLSLVVLIIGAISFGNPNLLKGKYSKSLIWGLVVLSISFILFSLFMPWVMPSFLGIVGNEIKEYNELGDALGGLMNPFIGIAAVIVTGLAFYMQYQANQQISDQFKLQQFESKFYEMLRLHKQNVEEMELSVYEEKQVNDPPLQTDPPTTNFEYSTAYSVKGRKVFTHYVQEFHLLLDCIGESDLQKINQKSFSNAYDMFFGGKEKFFGDEDIHFVTLRNVTEGKLTIIKQDGLKDNHYLHTYFDLFKGHVEYLGHYYRHLYMTVKYVVESYEEDGVLSSEGDCLKYLKILRAQLSNAEQVMLFYNWVAGGGNGYGSKWEVEDKRYYFSKYLMLHNLNFGMLFPRPNYFVKKKVKEIFDRSEKKKKLFELDVNVYLKDFINEDL